MSPTVSFDFHASPEALDEALDVVQLLCSELLSSSTMFMESLGVQQHRYRIVVPEGSVPVEVFLSSLEQALAHRVSIHAIHVKDVSD